MITQEIFKGLSENWRWASCSANGTARVHTEKPHISSDNVVVFKRGSLRPEFNETELPPEGLTAQVIERTDAWVLPYKTNGKGEPLCPEPECVPVNGATLPQAIFNGFGANWTWASIDKFGKAWVHTYEPNTAQRRNDSTLKNVEAPAFDRSQVFDARVNVKRTNFSNGPAFHTDEYGIALTPPAPAAKATTLTTDEAEAGGLWDFARSTENHAMVNQYGVVWFNTHKDGPEPRRSYAVQVTGVTHTIEHTRSQPVPTCNAVCCEADALPGSMRCAEHAEPGQYRSRPAPSFPEAGVPAHLLRDIGAGEEVLSVDYPAPGLRDDGNDESHGWTNELDEAKARAQRLLRVYVLDGINERPALNELQYMAIFGEPSE
jgi:hypothetical protein